MRPYPVKKEDKFYYRFNSEAGTVYLCFFISYSFLLQDYPDISKLIFTFNVEVETGKSKEQPLDLRIAATIALIVRKFLKDISKAVIYICGSSDRKEHIRKRKFDMWFKKHDDGLIIKVDHTAIVGEDKLLNSLLIHKDNPLKNRFLELFYKLNRDAERK